MIRSTLPTHTPTELFQITPVYNVGSQKWINLPCFRTSEEPGVYRDDPFIKCQRLSCYSSESKAIKGLSTQMKKEKEHLEGKPICSAAGFVLIRAA